MTYLSLLTNKLVHNNESPNYFVVYGLTHIGLLSLFGIGIFLIVYTLHPYLPILILAMTIGASLTIYGLIRSFRNAADDIHYPVEKAVEEHHLYLDEEEQKRLIDIINSGQVPDSLTPCNARHGIVRLDIILSKDCHFATLQLKELSRHTPITSRHYYSGDDAKKISALLESYNNDM